MGLSEDNPLDKVNRARERHLMARLRQYVRRENIHHPTIDSPRQEDYSIVTVDQKVELARRQSPKNGSNYR
jgi:hypothetical protein